MKTITLITVLLTALIGSSLVKAQSHELPTDADINYGCRFVLVLGQDGQMVCD